MEPFAIHLKNRLEFLAQEHSDDTAFCGHEWKLSWSELWKEIEKLRSSVFDRHGQLPLGLLFRPNTGPYTPIAVFAAIVHQTPVVLINSRWSPRQIEQVTSNLKGILTNAGEGLEYQEGQSEESLLRPGICYVTCSSGSTGEPKHIPVSYTNLEAFFNNFTRDLPDKLRRKIVTHVDFTFDIGWVGLIQPILDGGCGVLLGSERIMSMHADIDHIRDADVVVEVPSWLPMILSLHDRTPLLHPSLFARTHFLFCGEVLDPDSVNRFQTVSSSAKVVNAYGPAESTIWISSFAFSDYSGTGPMPIGTALPGVDIKAIAENDCPADAGSIGELVVAGDQVFSGYPGSDEAEFMFLDGRKYYRTGDFGSIDRDGMIQFHGRRDMQVKLSGYRTSLLSISRQVSKYAGVESAQAVLHEGKLVVFFRPEGEYKLLGLKRHCRVVLSAYEMPVKFVAVDEWPRNTNGKIDRRQLLGLL